MTQMSKFISSRVDLSIKPRFLYLMKMLRFRWFLQAFIVPLLFLGSLFDPMLAAEISASAAEQINKLMIDKASRTPAQRKINSNLLMEIKRKSNDPLFKAIPNLRKTIEVDSNDGVLVDIRAQVTDDLLKKIVQLGGTVISAFPQYQSIRARLPLSQLEPLSESSDVRFIRPAEKPMFNKDNTSEGDVAHGTDIARTSFGVDGSGAKVGVLSDGVDTLSARQATGDLPAVTVISGQAGAGDEGTAMLEIVFDLAPGAKLDFATAFGGQAQFAANITALANAGADVIVDDVFYFAEPVFQDGIIAQAVNEFAEAGGGYFSSSGNAGNLNDGTSGVWEGDFVASNNPPTALAGFIVNDFQSAISLNTITADPPSGISLHWSDPQGGSGNDYDLILLNSDGSSILSFSANTQDGDDDPIEFIDSSSANHIGNTLAIVKYSGSDRYLHMNTHRGQLDIATAGQTAGHATTRLGFGVAAVDVVKAAGGQFNGGSGNPVESFSSDGPRLIFYEADGTEVTPGNFLSSGGIIRDQPSIAAADGVMTAAPGFNPFFGTSAAAPHAAAIAALLEETGSLTPVGLDQVFSFTALDIEAPGFDRDSGWGVLRADIAVATTTSLPVGTCAVNELFLSGEPNDGPQIFRACMSIDASNGTFNNVTLLAQMVNLGAGFNTSGPFTIQTTTSTP